MKSTKSNNHVVQSSPPNVVILFCLEIFLQQDRWYSMNNNKGFKKLCKV